jgi:hypothetical protein
MPQLNVRCISLSASCRRCSHEKIAAAAMLSNRSARSWLAGNIRQDALSSPPPVTCAMPFTGNCRRAHQRFCRSGRCEQRPPSVARLIDLSGAHRARCFEDLGSAEPFEWTARGEPERGVAGRNRRAVDHLRLLDDPHREAGEIVFAAMNAGCSAVLPISAHPSRAAARGVLDHIAATPTSSRSQT